MSKEILVSCDKEETRLALLEDGALTELHFTRYDDTKIFGNIYKSKVDQIVSNIQAAFINIGVGKHAYLSFDDLLPDSKNKKIEDRLKPGQTVVVQIIKEAISNKGPKVSQEIGLPGKYIVYMPYSEKGVFISRRIEDKKERKRLTEIFEEIVPAKGALIVRTESEEKDKKDIIHDWRYINDLWHIVEKKINSTHVPSLVYQDLDLVFQIMRDLFSSDVDIVLIDSQKEYDTVSNFIKNQSPNLRSRIQLYKSKTPLFVAFGIEDQIKRLHKPVVKLPSGGHIVIQETESLCAIDVNTGKFRGDKSLDETILITNLEAAVEVARQIRLRNLGGIIVIDFIDMRSSADQQKVYDKFTQSMRNDKAKLKILPFNRLGLIEISRERKRESLVSLLTEECPECDGAGRVLSRESIFFKIRKELLELTRQRGGRVTLWVNPRIAHYFKERQTALEQITKEKIEIKSDTDLTWDNYRLMIS